VEREDRSDAPQFLPPEAPGPEPELGKTEERPTTQTWEQPQNAQAWAPPPGYPQQQAWQPQPQGWQPPPGQPAPGQPPPPPGYPPPPPQGWQQPPAYGWTYYAPPPPVPENGSAIAGFVTSLCAAGLLLLSGGLAGPVSLIAAPFGIHYSRKGKRAVDEGKTPKHRGLAQAGFIVGIITAILSVIAIAFWTVAIIVAANDDSGGGFNEPDGEFDSTRARAALTVVRVAALLLN
jgi:hypothetical protein